ncbi:MAG: Holliday junction branch migration protein RuvA [Oscillospiraceae bacterium]|nr:Holliday junction branch migration protein RuvA [Oscillospiraceae bacterium]
MYAYIRGKLVNKSNTYVVIDVNGIGYKVFMSLKSIEELGETEEVKVHTHYYVREDNISLYGFVTNEELRMFELLLSVSGIGAKSAIAMLSEITPSSFALAVITNDISKLVKIPGIGNKSAARIVLELKDKLKTEQSLTECKNEEVTAAIAEDNKTSEAISALQILGYTRKEIEKALEKIDIETLTLEDVIRKALGVLSL